MENKLWFKAKRYGWGWTPISWQGWLLLLIYVADLLFAAQRAGTFEHSGSDFLINFASWFILTTIPFLAICYMKGEEPRWHWGK